MPVMPWRKRRRTGSPKSTAMQLFLQLFLERLKEIPTLTSRIAQTVSLSKPGIPVQRLSKEKGEGNCTRMPLLVFRQQAVETRARYYY